MTAPTSLEVILKVAERCNINCSYCYVFNGGDDSYRRRPAIMAEEDYSQLLRFMKAGAERFGIERIQLDFHGGEPTLLGVSRLSSYAERFRSEFGWHDGAELYIQTNGILIDEAWIAAFAKYRIRVGVSIDGPASRHDLNRVDHRGQGTHARTVAGLAKLKQAAERGDISTPSVLSVIDPSFSASEDLRHIYSDLGITMIDFLLPDITRDAPGGYAKPFEKYLSDLVTDWFTIGDTQLRVRIIDSAISLLLGAGSWVSGFGSQPASAITVESDGTIAVDDVMRACGESEFLPVEPRVHTTSLEEFLLLPHVQRFNKLQQHLPQDCSSCHWASVCGGGHLPHRYKKTDGYDHSSVYCEALKVLYATTASHMIRSGVSQDRIFQTLSR